MKLWKPILVADDGQVGERIGGDPIGCPASAVPDENGDLSLICCFRQDPVRFPLPVAGSWLYIFAYLGLNPFTVVLEDHELVTPEASLRLVPRWMSRLDPSFKIDRWVEKDDGIDRDGFAAALNGDSYSVDSLDPSLIHLGGTPWWCEGPFFLCPEGSLFLGRVGLWITPDYFEVPNFLERCSGSRALLEPPEFPFFALDLPALTTGIWRLGDEIILTSYH